MTDDQFAAVRSDARQLRILAGAGTGKTRVLTHRIAYQINAVRIEPAHSLCLAFTNKAAREVKGRLGSLGEASSVQTGTFHSIAYKQVKARWNDIGMREQPELITNRLSYLSRVLPDKYEINERNFILGEINWATAQRISVEDYIVEAEKAGRVDSVPFSSVEEYFRKYLSLKRKGNFIDFDDIIQLAIGYLAEDISYAESRHWKYRDLFVDEFQDVNPLQFGLLQAWLSPKSSLTVVGDPCQAIYSWNGADSRFLNNFQEFFPDSQTITLKDNFRSTPEIIASATSILHNMGSLVPRLPTGRLPTIRAEEDEYKEAHSVANLIKELLSESITLGDQAVLVRTHAQIPPLLETFKERGIKYKVASDTNAEVALDEDDYVQILTLHAAKGLEWKIVHLCGVEEGFHPIAHARTDSAQDEERRLFFVGLTRAEKELHISWSRNRLLGSKRNRKPSIYIKEIANLLDPTPLDFGHGKQVKVETIRKDRRPLGNSVHQSLEHDTGKSHAQELDRLRRNIAKANDSSPDLVLSDENIETIISEEPKTLDDLRQILQISSVIIDRFGDQIIKIFS
jgi:DNA helicase-2/ATP-dependent DNA helicase PcrA